MSLPAIKKAVTSKVGRQILITQKHSPVLLFGVGVVGVVTTVVLACRATLKMEEVLDEAEKIKEQIEDTAALESDEYKDKDAEQDHKTNRMRTGFKIAKLYAPSVLVGLVTVGAFTGSHVILTRRNAALGAAYAIVDGSFREYRKRVVEELGEEKDREFRFGTETREIAVDTDEGVAVKTVKVAKTGRNLYSRIFDEYNPNWQAGNNYNMMFIRSVQNFANDKLNSQGHLFLNDVYDMLGMERSKEGAVVGWLKGTEHGGDGKVDFGIVETYQGMQFVQGNEKSVIIDPNVDGVIWNLI